MSEDVTLDEFGDDSASEDRKETPIGELPTDWGVEWVNDVVEINPDGFSEDDWPSETFEYISLSEASDGEIEDSKTTRLEDAPSRAQRTVQQGDVLVGTVRPKQRSHGFVSAEYDGKICSSGFGVLRTGPRVNPQYLIQEILSNRFFSQMEAYVAGSGYPSVKISDLKKHRVSVPPLSEQRKIATVLYTVDQAIEKSEEIESQLRRTQKGLVQDTLKSGLGCSETSDTGTKLGELPSHWNVSSIEEVVADEEHSFTDGARYSLSSAEIHDEGEARAVLLQEVGEGEFNDEDPKFATGEKYDEITHRAIYPGEVVVAKMAEPVARACIIPDKYDKYLLGCADVVRIQTNDKFDSRFLMYCMNSHEVWSQAVAHLRGTGRSRINLENIAELKIPNPPLDEQVEIADILESFDQRIQTEREYRNRLQSLKQGLMQDLLSGEVRTTNTNIQVPEEIAKYG